MLTAEAFSLMLDRIERHAKTHDAAERDRISLVVQLERAKDRVATLERDNQALERTRDRLAAERDGLKQEVNALFPLLIDDRFHVWIAFRPVLARTDEVGEVKDDAGSYASAGNHKSYADLIAAPLNPRCYLAGYLGRMCLVRLPGPPTGRLIILDNIPF